jgi:hypothetical protein
VTSDGFEVLRQWLDVMWRDALHSLATFSKTIPSKNQPDDPGGQQ